MLQLVDVYKIYHVGDEEVRALDGVSLAVGAGEFLGIVGPSGSGKSTLMHILGCLDTADFGTYYLDGRPVEFYSESQLATVRNEQIGFVFQSFNLIGHMTIAENVELPLLYRGTKASERRELVHEALSQVGLWERRSHRPNSVSGGQLQRAAIARAIVTRPSLLLGDEPTGNLDSRTGHEIMELFCELNARGRTIVLITHDQSIAKRTNRVVHIRDGKVVA
ncbi:MAG: ABC transporter ATP-binding protein [Coriobacteriales bacterium]|jgi:putative ABC transport system ATP-binding protein|nr:ABC transporter ATP-binding protein [Coriobacteriales bacterium]